jgi:hypothetical protein
MNLPAFESFEDIKKLGSAQLSITQKIHGTNAQIYIYPDDTGTLQLICGSRTRWIAPGDDNYGFAEMVHQNKQEFIEKLGPGRHYGEWAGPGINSGEGLKQKIFVLFDFWKYPPERPLPPNTTIVPVLYLGKFDLGEVDKALNELKSNGSKLVPGFMAPEGVVVRIKGDRYKVVFKPEETAWKKPDAEYQKQKTDKNAEALAKYGHLLQPIRLEKLLSRDERYIKEYPKTIGEIVKDYFADLVKENQVQGNDAEINGIRKQLAGNIFKFVQEVVEKQNVQA